MPDGRVSLPAELRKKHGLFGGGEVIVEDTGDAIVLRTLNQVVARAQAVSRTLVAGKAGASVDEFLADRHGERRGDRQPLCQARRRTIRRSVIATAWPWPSARASRP